MYSLLSSVARIAKASHAHIILFEVDKGLAHRYLH
jgi:hypothetical protein